VLIVAADLQLFAHALKIAIVSDFWACVARVHEYIDNSAVCTDP
jgi:hypothetical protein